MYKKVCEHYFARFSEKDLLALSEMFSETVTLRDWEIHRTGKEDVLGANRNIFDNVKTIQVMPLAMYEENQTVVAELEIIINGQDKLFVVDVITFDEEEKIVSIRAYRGN
jgi:hypothetical protein